jgi:hypothetical protein
VVGDEGAGAVLGRVLVGVVVGKSNGGGFCPSADTGTSTVTSPASPDAVVVLDDQHGPGHAAALPSDAALDTARSERRAQNQPRRAPS